jgi:hypothetical protein
MRLVNFHNPGHVDLDTIRTMGVNVKDNDNPIGYFGTGMKYAIATLLRTKHTITLQTNGETIPFTTLTKEIRGKPFEMIMMGDEQLGFTTDLGKNWEPWQAYRELASNAFDEGGKVTTNAVEDDTVFTVIGEGIIEAHRIRDTIFLQSEPWLLKDGIEVHRGESKYLFYRGVRVHKLDKPSRFTYNFVSHMALTEDRTLASPYMAQYELQRVLPTFPEPKLAERLVSAGEGHYEERLSWRECTKPSDEFLDALEEAYKRDRARFSRQLQEMLNAHRKVGEYEPFMLSRADEQVFAEALTRLRRLNAIVAPEDVVFAEHLGPGVYAVVDGGKIYISRQTLANGLDFLTITLYEEWIHLRMGYHDESRGMQQYLLDKILELLKEAEA